MDKLKLLANLPIYVENIPIYSPLLRDIAILGKEQYSACLSSCIITKDSLIDKTFCSNCKDDFDVLLKLCLENNLMPNLIYSLFYFTKLQFNIQKSNNDIVFISESVELNRYNYNSLIKAIKYVNCLDTFEERELDEFDRRCLEMERKIQQQQNNDRPELEDLISAVANMDGNGLNIINIWDLNIYQFYEQLQRGQLKEQYYLAIKQLLAGAKPEEVKIESYFKTIK